MSKHDFDIGSTNDGSANNKRLPVILCLDTSQSMLKVDETYITNGNTDAPSRRIDQLNAALREWGQQLKRTPQLRRQAYICVLSFNTEPKTEDVGGGASLGFVRAENFEPPNLQAGGITRLDLAVSTAIDKVTEHKASTHVETHRVKIWIISDGQPTDEKGYRSDLWRSILPRVRQGEQNQDFALYTAGVHGADMNVLNELGGNGSFDLRGLSLGKVLEIVTQSASFSSATVEEEKRSVEAMVDKMHSIFAMIGKK